MVLVEIDTGDYLMTEQHFALRIGFGHWAQGDRQTMKRFADAEGVATVTDPSSGPNSAHFEPRGYSIGGSVSGKGMALGE
jgi:hypothetical protein